MIRLQVNPEYRNLLEASRLSSYPQFMNLDVNNNIEKNAQREVQKLTLGGQGFYLKRVWVEKTSSALESYLAGKLAHSRPFREMLHYRFLKADGFRVATVVAVGEELKFGFPQAGFILTREVEGRDLPLIYRDADSKIRKQILSRVGGLLGKLHNRGYFGSTRLKDIICNYRSDADMDMVLIDREVRNPCPRQANADQILSRLLLNVRRQIRQGEVFSDREWQSFCRHYCEALNSTNCIEPESLYREIEAIRQRSKSARLS